ncbi:MAG: hypothetical protein PF436_11825 [Prolixibacteraceae bacterium]|jgi:hypothetical protein|nr:hypothetical protein [Prolixibacteraceae bacterium]
MKQKFTSEKNKYLENKNLVNETMFNFKISCLMKKQVINLMMTLAIVFGLSVSAMAQFEIGESPGNADLFVVGSVGEFSVTRGESGSQLVWSLYNVNTADDIGAPPVSDAVTTAVELVTDRTGATQLGDGQTVTQTGTDYIVFVEFKSEPATDQVYCLEVREIASNECISIRRSYMSVFDFDVDVYWCADAAADTSAAPFTGNAKNGSVTDTISWHNKVINNTMDQAWLTTGNGDLEADSVNNPYDGDYKIDSVFFAVEIEMTGAPDLYTLENLKWRFRYNAPNAANDSIYEIYAAGQPTDGILT